MGKKQVSESGSKTGYYGYSSESRSINSGKKNKKTNSGKSGGTAFTVILVMLQLLLSIALVGMIFYKKITFLLSPEILTGIIAVLVVLLAIVLSMQKGSKGVKRGGKAISIIVIIILSILVYLISPINQMSGKKVSDKPFVVFVSANDTFGNLNEDTTGRSDTNILAVINPKTHVVLMLSTPRDYYVEITADGVAQNSYDKLTHVGLYGNGIAYNNNGEDVTASDWQWGYEVNWHPGNNALMDTLQSLYKFDIPEDRYHYVKLNFTGFAKLIDTIGGITVDVDTPFKTKTYASYGEKDTGERKTYTYKKGEMEMDGATALTFARERHSFASGDMQRNQNQVKVIKAMADKVLSGSILFKWTNVVNAIEDSFSTDIDLSSMVSLLTQVTGHKDYDGWNIMSFSVTGTSSREICTFTGTSLSVVTQNEESISNASNLINMVLSGDDSVTIKQQIKAYNK